MKLRSAALLWLAMLLLFIANSADFLFNQPFYEWWDSAANAISVERAKHFEQLYGAYSRWGFCHPGPALFYLQALGEWLFYDLWRICPAPYNAQTLFHLCLTTGLFVIILRIFTHWLPRRAWQLFLPLAVALSALHFVALNRLPNYDILLGPSALTGVWPVHAVILPFACMLVAGASVAAGRGRDLPLLMVCAGLLLHLHVSEPLMVVPLTTLSWLGLVLSTPSLDGQGNGTRHWLGKVGATWRNHRRAHWLALLVIVVTALPVVIDLCKGADSNLARILEHMRHYRGEHKSLGRSVMYFLQFGAYTPYHPYTSDHFDDMEFGHFDFVGAMAYLRANALAYTLWAGAVALVAHAAIRRRETNTAVPSQGQPEIRRFFACAGILTTVIVCLSLYWGIIQDGRMYYYNAWFNFAVYGVVGLLALAALASMLVRASFASGSWRWLLATAWIGAVATCIVLAEPLRVRAADPKENAAMHAGIMRAMAAFAPPETRDTAKILRFGSWYWDGVTALALQLRRDGHRFIVADQWRVIFGEETTWSVYQREQPRPRAERWFIDVEPIADRTLPGVPFSMLHNVSKIPVEMKISADLPVLDPAGTAGAASIVFRKGGNSLAYMVGGWADEELWCRWTSTKISALAFQPAMCGPDGVRLTLDAEPFLLPRAGLRRQRVQLLFNGQPIGGEQQFAGGSNLLAVHIPASMWNDAATEQKPGVVLEMKLPDAIAPQKLDPSIPDKRTLALHFASVSVAPWGSAAESASVENAVGKNP